MPVIQFPNNPTLDQIYTSPDGDSWSWAGYAWVAVGGNGFGGPQGSAGPQGIEGPQGSIGLTGSVGPQGEIGLTGSVGPQGNIGLTGSIGPQGGNQFFTVVTGISTVADYVDQAFWFDSQFTSWLGTTGATAQLSVLSMQVNGDEKILTPQSIEITSATGPEDLWFNMGGTGGIRYGNATITNYNIGNFLKTPVKWLSHLDSIGLPHGIIFSGINDLSPYLIALEQDVDFEIVIERTAPGLADNPSYWYQRAYSSSTKIATSLFSSAGPTGPWGTWQQSEHAFAAIGTFYK